VSKKLRMRLQVNGAERVVQVWPMQRLLDVLRENLQLTGVKEGCGEGECGACSVLLNGVLVNSCLIPVCQAEESSITTVEGLESERELHPIQQSFINCGGTQCGFCTPGMLMAAASLLKTNPNPSEAEVRKSISGNLCRCTGYQRIINSVLQAVQVAQQVEHESVR
jgi:carbon-monoxide dehydrogenase small subunit